MAYYRVLNNAGQYRFNVEFSRSPEHTTGMKKKGLKHVIFMYKWENFREMGNDSGLETGLKIGSNKINEWSTAEPP